MSLKCQCLTAKGTQCSRNASKSYNYCYQHKNCDNIYGSKLQNGGGGGDRGDRGDRGIAGTSILANQVIETPENDLWNKTRQDFYNKKVDRYHHFLHLFRSNPSMELMRQIDELAKEIENFD
jgi:hypothetical protein